MLLSTLLLQENRVLLLPHLPQTASLLHEQLFRKYFFFLLLPTHQYAPA